MNNCKFLYFIIPTINGEIDDDPIIFVSNKNFNHLELIDMIFESYEEVTIYRINLQTYEVIEIK